MFSKDISFFYISVSKQREFLQKKAFHTSSLHYKDDYYKILGVSKSADQKEIKKAYYKVNLGYSYFYKLPYIPNFLVCLSLTVTPTSKGHFLIS